jgi:hypothetical protein
MSFGDPGECLAEIGLRVHAIELGGVYIVAARSPPASDP